MLQAIIFDMDGVIVDTEYAIQQAQTVFLQELNERSEDISEEDFASCVGTSHKDMPALLKRITGSSLPAEELADRHNAFYDDFFERVDYLSIFRSDIKQIIEYAKEQGIKLAVASSSGLEHIHNILTQCGIIQDFDQIISGHQFEQSKPNPEIYLHTMKLLGVDPQYSVAIEDSSAGISAAKSAGMTVIGYQEPRLRIDQSKADYLGRDMLDILRIIKDLHQQ